MEFLCIYETEEQRTLPNLIFNVLHLYCMRQIVINIASPSKVWPYHNPRQNEYK